MNRDELAGVLAWRFAQFWLPIPLGGLAYLSLRFGSFGRAAREAGERSTFGQGADRRVWDQASGEYRLVATPGGADSGGAEQP